MGAMKTTTAQSPKRKPTSVRQTEIVTAAMRILATDGARHFTTERVAAAVGITGGTIFRHFPSMDAILDGIVDHIEEILFADFPPDASDPLVSLRQFFEQRVRAIAEHPEMSRLLMIENLIPHSKSQKREKRLHEFKRVSQRFVLECLEKAARSGQIAADVRPQDGTRLVLGAIHAFANTSVRRQNETASDESVRHTWRLLERALTNSHNREPEQ